ncbi:cellulose biosynthesis protein BcsS [Rhodopseudomonas palustris]|uniref:cellulose biosynthesis protein BcsS n=1 Tax=Rhodopseudomonas palustris TaxID=1076 RepID=UPI0002FACABC
MIGSSAGGVAAQEAAIDAPIADPLSGGSRPEQFLLFAGVDLWHASVANYAGLHWAPAGLHNDGVFARLLLSRNFERYGATSTIIFRGALLGGVRFKRGGFEVKLMAGPELENADPTSPFDQLRGTRLGLQAAAETWWQPTPELLLATSLTLTAHGNGNGYGGRVAAGWRLLDQAWIGPEASAFSDHYSTQYRVGLHVTGLRVEGLEWSAAAGYLEDGFARRGGYGRIGMLLRQ